MDSSRFQQMQFGKDVRNKIFKINTKIYAFGGNKYNGEVLDLLQNKWFILKTYKNHVRENLDSWASALQYDISSNV